MERLAYSPQFIDRLSRSPSQYIVNFPLTLSEVILSSFVLVLDRKIKLLSASELYPLLTNQLPELLQRTRLTKEVNAMISLGINLLKKKSLLAVRIFCLF